MDFTNVDSSLFNRDLAPIPVENRSWGTYNYASLWVAMSVCIPTYMMASGLIAGGMDWIQAISTILLGNLIVPDSHAVERTRGHPLWHTVSSFCAASFGVRGANVPCCATRTGCMRLVRNSDMDRWPGHLFHAVHHLAKSRIHPRKQLGLFLFLLVVNMLVIWRGIETIKFLEGIGAPFMLLVGLLLLFWVTNKAGGLGPVLHAGSKFHTNGEFLRFFHPITHGMVGFLVHGCLNIPDFTRYAKSQRAQMTGQALGLPLAMTLYSFIGVAVTSASVVLFGEPVWDPVLLLGRFHQPLIALVALIALLLATLNTNVAANVVSPSNDFSNIRPSLISFRTGGLITGVPRPTDDAVEIVEQLQFLYIWLAGGLFGAARSHRGHHDLRLFPFTRPAVAGCGSLPPWRRIRIQKRIQPESAYRSARGSSGRFNGAGGACGALAL